MLVGEEIPLGQFDPISFSVGTGVKQAEAATATGTDWAGITSAIATAATAGANIYTQMREQKLQESLSRKLTGAQTALLQAQAQRAQQPVIMLGPGQQQTAPGGGMPTWQIAAIAVGGVAVLGGLLLLATRK